MNRAEAVIAFIETLCLPDGDMAGQPFILMEWQAAFILRAYSRDGSDVRIVTRAILSMPRKNGKTALIAALLLVHLVGPEAKRFGQLYSCGVDRTQAAVLYNYARNMVLMDEELSDRINCADSKFQLSDRVSGSVYTALSADVKNKHGKSASFLVFDDLSQFSADSELYTVMTTSTGANADAMTWVISTQAPSDDALLSQLIDYAEKCESGEFDDPSTILALYAAPSDADPWSEDVWQACNPALGHHRTGGELRQTASMARRLPSLENAFRNLYLNQRVSGSANAIDLDLWRLAQSEFDPFEDADELAHVECFAGLDLGWTKDLCSLALTWRFDDGHIKSATWSWSPGFDLDRRGSADGAPYRQWADDPRAFLTATETRQVSADEVAKFLRRLIDTFNVVGLAFDQAKIRFFLEALEREGIDAHVVGASEDEYGLPMWRHSQGWSIPIAGDILAMPRSIVLLEEAFATATLSVRSSPLLTWCMSNARLVANPSGDRKWLKKRELGRIDEVIALTMSVGLALRDGAGERGSMNDFLSSPVGG